MPRITRNERAISIPMRILGPFCWFSPLWQGKFWKQTSPGANSQIRTEGPAVYKTAAIAGQWCLSSTPTVRRQSIGVSAPSAKPTRATIPLPDFVEPMKATLVDSMPPGSWLYEIKLDGYRALALRGGSQTRILSRNQKDLGKKFQVIADSIATLPFKKPLLTAKLSHWTTKADRRFNCCKASTRGWCARPSHSTLSIYCD